MAEAVIMWVTRPPVGGFLFLWAALLPQFSPTTPSCSRKAYNFDLVCFVPTVSRTLETPSWGSVRGEWGWTDALPRASFQWTLFLLCVDRLLTVC